jgi:integrase/recombinase XerD
MCTCRTGYNIINPIILSLISEGYMGLEKQAKILNRKQIELISAYLGSKRNGIRNETMFLLSVRAGLRAKEIANITWSMITDANGELGDFINLTNIASKGKSGRVIPINKQLKSKLTELYTYEKSYFRHDINSRIVRTERVDATSAQTIVNMFQGWYIDLGLIGCSSHSGRRTFITNAAKKISTVGGSLRDVQFLAGHTSLQTTQRYIEGDSEARMKVVDLI